MPVQVKVHPLGEILSKKLFGIETVPKAEQTKMVRRAIKAAMKYADDEAAKYKTYDGKEVSVGDSVWVRGSCDYYKTTVIEPVTNYTFEKAIRAHYEGGKK